MHTTTYQLQDFGNGQRLEVWGPYRLIRPDPTASGLPASPDLWKNVDAIFRGEKGQGAWEKLKEIPEHWLTQFDDMELLTRLTPYKHTGIFPEQRQNWNFARHTAKNMNKRLNILNLFAYTGGASVALAKDGHFVTHVDAAKPSIAWAKENALANTIAPDCIRWILDDAAIFASRELKRGKTYDGIILDPPAFGHSPTGKTWRSERDLKPLLETCVTLLSSDPGFMILNGYAHHDTPEDFHRLLTGILRTKRKDLTFTVTADDLSIEARDGRSLSTGVVARVIFAPHSYQQRTPLTNKSAD